MCKMICSSNTMACWVSGSIRFYLDSTFFNLSRAFVFVINYFEIKQVTNFSKKVEEKFQVSIFWEVLKDLSNLETDFSKYFNSKVTVTELE